MVITKLKALLEILFMITKKRTLVEFITKAWSNDSKSIWGFVLALGFALGQISPDNISEYIPGMDDIQTLRKDMEDIDDRLQRVEILTEGTVSFEEQEQLEQEEPIWVEKE